MLKDEDSRDARVQLVHACECFLGLGEVESRLLKIFNLATNCADDSFLNAMATHAWARFLVEKLEKGERREPEMALEAIGSLFCSSSITTI